MSEPLFLSLEQVEILHQRSLALHGGGAGTRDQGGLESAVFQPQQLYFYGQPDLYDLAAAYAFHIAESQAYIDGNKRTGAAATALAPAAALALCRRNGFSFRACPAARPAVLRKAPSRSHHFGVLRPSRPARIAFAA